jgi:SpoVK/Ycf46/Vps4 family AAA+-type ATPase
MGHFKVKKITNFRELELETPLEESDYALLTNEDKFVQFEYVDDKEKTREPYVVKPGLFHIVKTMTGLELERTTFVKDEILNDLVSTKDIEEAVDCFIKNIPLYKEFGIEIAKRSILLYGPQGTGKSVALSKVAQKYQDDGKTAIVIWHTSKWEAHQIKDLIQSFSYEGVEKLILIAEDLGGIEREEVRMGSDSSLLSLLDNNEKTFTIPVCIIATTNFPETFMANIVNRPGRFDDKLEIGNPKPEAREKLLKFFSKDSASAEACEFIKTSKCETFSVAHIREAYIRSRLRSKDLTQVLDDISREITTYNKGFQNKSSMGFGFGSDD